MKKIVILLSILLTACATTGNYQKTLQSWVGQDADRLVQTWGVPTNSYTANDGTKTLEYSFQNGSVSQASIYGNVATGYTRPSYCQTTFMVDKTNTVTNWRWRGNACKSKAMK